LANIFFFIYCIRAYFLSAGATFAGATAGTFFIISGFLPGAGFTAATLAFLMGVKVLVTEAASGKAGGVIAASGAVAAGA
jgi:hypothetical protein